MPVVEAYPRSTTVIAAGWVNPTNAYRINDNLAYSETDDAEQEYDEYNLSFQGSEVIDRVFVKLKDRSNLTTVVQGDASSFEGTLRVYNGTTWNNYQITADDFAVSTANDESLTYQSGDATDAATFIDVTAFLNTHAKLNAARIRLLHNISATAAGITQRWSVDGVNLMVCYSFSDSVPISRGAATTKRDSPVKAAEALRVVRESLNSHV